MVHPQGTRGMHHPRTKGDPQHDPHTHTHTKALIALHKDNFGPSSGVWQPGRGLPVEWFTSHQQRHILLHRAGTVPTMAELARRTAYQEVIGGAWSEQSTRRARAEQASWGFKSQLALKWVFIPRVW